MTATPRASQSISLRKLFPSALFTAGDDIQVTSCSRRAKTSRKVHEGHLYVAGVDSLECDEEEAALAVRQGATAIMTERLLPIPVPQCLVGDVRVAYGQLVHALADSPSEKLLTIGVIGTHGKTSVALMIASMLRKLSGRAASWTSLGQTPEPTSSTRGKPDATGQETSTQAMASWLRQAVKAKYPVAVVELSEETLLHRTASGLTFDILVIPSLRHSQRHDRLEARGIETAIVRSIEQLKEHGVVVYNADDARLNRFMERHAFSAIGYGLDADADIRGRRIERYRGTQTMMVSAGNSLMPAITPLVGDHHLRHMLAAITVGHAFGLELFEVIGGVEQLTAIPGRMQTVVAGQEFSLYIDLSDQADRLAMALHGMSKLGGRIICVAEVPKCATAEQRAAYGRVLGRAASQVILTQSREGMPTGQRKMWEVLDGCERPAEVQLIPNRSIAIELAIRSARPGDQVILAGWGERTWSGGPEQQEVTDQEIAMNALRKLGDFEPAVAQMGDGRSFRVIGHE